MFQFLFALTIPNVSHIVVSEIKIEWGPSMNPSHIRSSICLPCLSLSSLGSSLDEYVVAVWGSEEIRMSVRYKIIIKHQCKLE